MMMKPKSILVSALFLVGCANSADKLAPEEPQPTAKPPETAKPSETTQTPKTPDVTRTGSAEAPRAVIGDSAPEFKLIDQHGKLVALSEIRGESNVAIVFHRSAVW